MSSLLKQNSSSKSSHLQLFRLSVETPTNEVFVYDLLAVLEKQDAEQLQVFKAKCDKAVVAESKAVHEMEVKSLEPKRFGLKKRRLQSRIPLRSKRPCTLCLLPRRSIRS